MADVVANYASSNLTQTILGGLRDAGKNRDRLTVDDLAPIDEFHTRGRAATVELAALLMPSSDQNVIDIGCGLGGPSRYLAAKFGCRVSGIDLTPDFIDTARELARRVGLADLTDYRVGDATKLPFADQSFDIAWTQHAAMNIADKAALYREAFRVLRPGGRLLISDVLQGPGGELHYPTPWAYDASISHLVTGAELTRLLREAGFEITHERDRTPDVVVWLREQAATLAQSGPPALGLRLLFTADGPARFANLGRNLAEARAEIHEVIARRPG